MLQGQEDSLTAALEAVQKQLMLYKGIQAQLEGRDFKMSLCLTCFSSVPLSQALLHSQGVQATSEQQNPLSPLSPATRQILFVLQFFMTTRYRSLIQRIWMLFSEDYLKQKDESKKQYFTYSWLHAQSRGIAVDRPASIWVVVSNLSANCCATRQSCKGYEAQGAGLQSWLCLFLVRWSKLSK